MKSNFNDNLKSTRHGFTLVEMLFVVAIIGVLGAMTAGILGKAHKDAQFAASRSRIIQIEAIMQSVTENFEVRRMPFRNADLPAPSRTANLNLSRRIRAAILMAEYPGPVFNGTDFETNPNAGQLNLPAALSAFVPAPTAEMQFWQTIAGDANLDLPGEYLYLILERIDIDGSSALESLGPSVVANTDEDAYPEIVDAFGDSMQLRILQVADTTVEETDWTLSVDIGSGIKIPVGYEFLDPTDPTKPRSIHNIRFQVVSPNLEEVE